MVRGLGCLGATVYAQAEAGKGGEGDEGENSGRYAMDDEAITVKNRNKLVSLLNRCSRLYDAYTHTLVRSAILSTVNGDKPIDWQMSAPP